MNTKRGKKRPDTLPKCRNCGTTADPTDLFCRRCGAALKGGKPNGGVKGLIGLRGFGLAILALTVFYVVLNYGVGGSGSDPSGAQRIPISQVGGAAGAATESAVEMSPRAAADQLYNRALAAYESGDSATARQFIPMALAAYSGLEQLDLDARYHVALLSLASDDPAAAAAQADTMLLEDPNHLLGLIIAAQAHDRSGRVDLAADYFRHFLDAYTPEAAASRREYLDHGRVLTARRETAAQYLNEHAR